MVKDHSDSQRGNPLSPHGLLFSISSKGFFYMLHPTDRIARTTVLDTNSRAALAGTRNNSMGPTEQHFAHYANGERERERNVLFNDALEHIFIYGYMTSDIWLRTILIVRKETRCRHIGYSYRLTARVLLYAPSHRQDNTYHGLCYTSRGALAGTRNSSMGPPHEGSIRRPIAP